MTDEITTLFALGLGPWTTPLRGKVPILDAWQTLDPVDEPQVREWVECGYNLGLRTGERSGVVVIDDDQARNGGGDYTPPETSLVVSTPTGGRHFYYRAPDDCPGNSASRLAPHIDVRGEGGQVVVPPSVHPIARKPYRWVSQGEPGTFPAPVRVNMTAPAPERGHGYAETAMHREVHAVRTAPEGARNHTLNRAAFSLGQLVAGGMLDETLVRANLEGAASICGLSSGETAMTIASGLSSGRESPRTAPERAPVATVTPPTPGGPDVLVPGSHILTGGTYVEQGNHSFAAQALAKLAPGSLYRRAAQLGEIHDGQFVPTTVHRLRSIVDGSVRLTVGKPPTSPDDEPKILFKTCSRDHASVILDYGQVQGDVRELQHLTTHPVCTAPDFEPARPGWNATSGVFLADPVIPEPLPLPEAKAVLEDLVADFPFQDDSDRANFLGLMLTPMLRPALREPVPMHLITSPMERTGKTKLAEIVLGVAVAGRRVPAMQLGDREEEREKRILSVLLRGQGLLHLDNLAEHLNSAALASLLTSSEYQGRVLGSSTAPTIPNGLTVVGTGNNVHASGELAKRIVPIRLLPDTETPETRTDFRHPDLMGFVTAERPRVLGALMGLINAWRSSGRPLHRAAFGGFERWTAVTGGILKHAGYDDWLGNMSAWRGAADDAGQEHRALAAAWFAAHGRDWARASGIYDLAVEMDLYGWLDSGKTDRARRRSFGVRVLNRLAGRVLTLPREAGGESVAVRIQSDGVGSRRRVRLAEVV